MPNVLIGKNSYLAASLTGLDGTWAYLSHADVADNKELLKSAGLVINYSYHPLLRTDAYDRAYDIDSTVASMIGPQTFYVMLSTRMVYGESEPTVRPFSETDPCAPTNMYGMNKLAVEEGLKKLVSPEKLIILRPANIFGFEYGRKTFLGHALSSLKEAKTIYFDIAPHSKRDFLPIKSFSGMVSEIIRNPQAGTYNLGSGIGITNAEISAWLIEGYGDGEVVYTDNSTAGQFVLDVQKIYKQYELHLTTKEDLKAEFVDCGKKLRLI